jgi:hypothetical protein
MNTTTLYPKQKVAITFPTVQIEHAKEKARRELGFALPELIRHLLAKYLEAGNFMSHREYISPAAEERLARELQAFEKTKKDAKIYYDAQSLVNSLEK